MLPRTEIGQWSGRYSITHLILAILVFLSLATAGEAATKPATLAEVALYQGPGREQILIDGAKKEGEVMFYNSHSWFVTVGKEFEKKYPFLKVLIWRSDPMEIVKRVTEEFASGRSISDVIETNAAPMAIFQRNGFLQEYYSPEIGAYREELKLKGKTGVYYCAHRETYIGLGFNTKLIPLVILASIIVGESGTSPEVIKPAKATGAILCNFTS